MFRSANYFYEHCNPDLRTEKTNCAALVVDYLLDVLVTV